MQGHGVQVFNQTKDKWELSDCHTTSACAGITHKILKPSGYNCCLTMHQRTQCIRHPNREPMLYRTCNKASPVTNGEANTNVHETNMHGRDTNELNAMQWQQTVAGMRPHSKSTVLFKCDFPVHFILFMGGTEPQTSFMQHKDVKVSSQCDARLTLQPFPDHHEHVPMTQAAGVPNRQ